MNNWCFIHIILLFFISIRLPMIRGFSSAFARGNVRSRLSRPLSAKGAGKDGDKITPRSVDYSQWYQDVVRHSDLVDRSPVRGCMVIKPWGMAIWERLKDDLDAKIKAKGVQNAYFPLFIPLSFLSKEAEHIDGFAKECAVVTHHRLCMDPETKALVPDSGAKLEEPLVVRPTSETIIWDSMAKWITSHRDLPMKLNQWANVVRWENRPRAFLRTSEFLWQEGHTAHANKQDAYNTTLEMLELYANVCHEMLAIPVVKGVKSPSERFAGADETYTIEALMQNGWALQAGTSHDLGQKFADAFDVTFLDKEGKRQKVWSTSWGVSTRLMGAMVMTHSDDNGLVLPPKLSPIQVVIVPIFTSNQEEKKALDEIVDEVYTSLMESGVRVKVDDRDHMRPGAKYFEWERKGVPLRIEIGPRDVKEGHVMMKSRLADSVKLKVQLENVTTQVQDSLIQIHKDLFQSASKRLHDNTIHVSEYKEMVEHFEKCDNQIFQEKKNQIKESKSSENVVQDDEDSADIGTSPGFFLAPWYDDEEAELEIKVKTRATIRCFPLNGQDQINGKLCFYSGRPATHMAIFARAF